MGARWLVVDAEAITGIDFSAGGALIDRQRDLARKGIVLALARVSDQLRADLDSQEVTLSIGANRFFSSRKHCIDAHRATLSELQNEIPRRANSAAQITAALRP
jgi:MFS superfamily sulfate permease-like transporter